MAEKATPIPLTVIGGYLGAGKTTLLNHVLAHNDGRRYAVLVNDFGSINIDAALIEHRDDSVIKLDNGCLCCSLVGGFAAALQALQQADPLPQHVIVEASGVADPARIGYYAYVAPYEPAGVLVVADAETVRARATDPFVGDAVLRQLSRADLVVLNKTDLVSAEALGEVRDWLAQTVPGARRLEVAHGRIPPKLFLDVSPTRLAGAPAAEDHGARYASWSLVTDRPLGEASFRACVEGWPETVLRAKGFVFLAEDPRRRYVFQLIGRRWTLTAEQPWPAAARTELVIIGLAGQLEAEPLIEAIHATETYASSRNGLDGPSPTARPDNSETPAAGGPS